MVSGFGGSVQMTPVECASGTDRIATAAAEWDENAVINIQGDEPLIDPAAIDIVARHLKTKPADPIVTLAAPAASADRENPNVVKVVTDLDGWALYFSRAPIPYLRQGSSAPLLRHIGIYGYQRDALLAVASLPPSPLESCESLEQLRALENSIAIRVIQTECAWPGVDTIEDLEHVELLLQTTLRAELEARTGSRE